MNKPETRKPPLSPGTPGHAGRSVQGEGNYDAARRYRQGVEDFVRGDKVADAAEKSRPRSADDARALVVAEKLGRARTMGDDPVDQEVMQDRPASGSKSEPDDKTHNDDARPAPVERQ